MKITLVTDQFYENNHGTSVSAQRIYDGLVARGHQVNVIAIDKDESNDCGMKERQFGKPINNIIHSQGMQLAKPDKDKIREIVAQADIVHVYLPFKLGYTTIEICRELNVPCTAAFHIVPENITSTLYMNNFFALNSSLWSKFYNSTYKYVKHIHCPSLMVAKQLELHRFNSYLHVISNGCCSKFKVQPQPKPSIFNDKFIICFAGRFSREKRYDLIIKAVAESKFKDKIQLIFGGKGPVRNQIMNMAKELPNYPVFSFFTHEQLNSLFNFADLYIHPADTEVEGLSCLEAITCGCVPIVSDSPKSASSQFTLSKHSVFENGDYKSLAQQIDWWLSHPQELQKHRVAIARHAQKFAFEKSMDYYLDMFEQAIKDWDCEYKSNSKEKAMEPTIINYYAKK